MAEENRIITFNYAKTNYDVFKKQTIPATNKCMTKAEINQYLNAESAPLANYVDNRFVPRSSVVGLYPPFTSGTGFNASISNTRIQTDGKILIAGYFTLYKDIVEKYLIRLNTDGSKDTSFNIGTGFNNFVNSTTIQSDGKLLLGGAFTSYNGTSLNRIIRLNSNASIDTSFNIGTGFNDITNDILVQPDGKIVVIGQFTTFNGNSRNYIIRLNSNASIDTSFNIGTGFNYITTSINIQSDGKLLIGGAFETYKGLSAKYIIRLNTDGSIDTSFNIGTGFNSVFAGGVNDITIQSDGKLLIGGSFTSYNGVAANHIIRLNSNGSIDTSFNTGTGFNNFVNSIAIQSDGKILIGGFFTSYNGVTANRIIRLNSNGSIDTSFNTGTGFNTIVNDFFIQTNGKIIVGGYFTSYNGLTANYIIRLNSDGSINQ